jgi:hypothetical protein
MGLKAVAWPEFHLQRAWQMHNGAGICARPIEDWIPKLRE